MTWVYFLKKKFDGFVKFQSFCNLILNQYNKTLKTLRSDHGGEYVNNDMKTYFTTHDIIDHTTCLITPQQNGTIERKHRTFLSITRAIMLESQVPHSIWPEAVATSTYLTNQLPIKILNF